MSQMGGPEVEEWFSVSLKLWEASVDITVKISAACSFRLSVETVFRMSHDHPMYDAMVSWMSRALFVCDLILFVFLDVTRFFTALRL
jgi:hypothetical protein